MGSVSPVMMLGSGGALISIGVVSVTMGHLGAALLVVAGGVPVLWGTTFTWER